jgi:2-oxoglutarate ferredoxin oxidoreductase subunit beta
MALSIAQLSTKEAPTWCPGCGDFMILGALKSALAELDIEQHNTLIVSGIGCGSKTPHFIKTYGFEGLHGRALPVATGAKLANNKLNVMIIAGDGDSYGIGGNHYMHSMRRNLDVTLIVQNNAVYGLTKGQTSPTSQKGFVSNSTPSGVLEEPVNPISWAIVAGATYVARGSALDMSQLKALIVNGTKHKGFALIDIFQPCTTYNKVNTTDWYRQVCYKLEETDHNPEDKTAALKRAEEWGQKIPTGLFYKVNKPTYEDGLPQIATTPLVNQDIKNVNIDPLLAKYS